MENLSGLIALSKRIEIPGEGGHKARVQFLRVLFKRDLVLDLVSGCLDGINPNGVDICLCQDDSKQVIDEFVRASKEEQFDYLVRAYLWEVWARWTMANRMAYQLSLF